MATCTSSFSQCRRQRTLAARSFRTEEGNVWTFLSLSRKRSNRGFAPKLSSHASFHRSKTFAVATRKEAHVEKGFSYFSHEIIDRSTIDERISALRRNAFEERRGPTSTSGRRRIGPVLRFARPRDDPVRRAVRPSERLVSGSAHEDVPLVRGEVPGSAPRRSSDVVSHVRVVGNTPSASFLRLGDACVRSWKGLDPSAISGVQRTRRHDHVAHPGHDVFGHEGNAQGRRKVAIDRTVPSLLFRASLVGMARLDETRRRFLSQEKKSFVDGWTWRWMGRSYEHPRRMEREERCEGRILIPSYSAVNDAPSAPFPRDRVFLPFSREAARPCSFHSLRASRPSVRRLRASERRWSASK